MRAQIRTILLVAVVAVLAFSSSVQSASAATTDARSARVTPGNTELPRESVLELAQKCLRLYMALPRAKDGGASDERVRTASESCRRAIEASGLSSGDFWTKYRPLLDASQNDLILASSTDKETPVSRPAESSPLFVLNLCVQPAAELTADATQDQAKLAGEACRKALAAR